MHDETRHPGLDAALTRAAAYGIGGARTRPLDSPADGLRFVQEQIAGTLLARRLVFSFGDARRVACDVAGGRLLRFTDMDPSGTALTTGVFSDMSEADQVDGLLRDFAQLLRQSLEGETCVSLQTSPLNDEIKSGGVPADQVAHALGLSATPVPSAEFHKRFVDEAGASLLVAACLEGDVLFPLLGEEEEVEHLAASLDSLFADLDSVACQAGSTGNLLINLGYHEASHAGVVCVLHGQTMLIASTAPNSQAALARTWYALQRAA